VALIAVIVLASALRLWGLGSRPILYFDSGAYLGEGAFLRSAAQRTVEALLAPGPPGPLQRIALATEDGTDGHPPDLAKPGHAVLVAMSMLLLGKTVLAGTLVSALAGVGTVAVTCALGMFGWGPRVAVPAGLMLAISGQGLVYSREPLVESDGMFFAALAALVYLRARRGRTLFLAGTLFGIAFTCNNRLWYLPAVLAPVELAGRPGFRQFIKRTVVLAAGALMPLATIELAYVVARWIGRTSGVRADFLDYAQQMVAFIHMNPPDLWRPDEWPTYFVDLAFMDGLPVLALFLVGIGILVLHLRGRHTSQSEMLLIGSVLVPLALYSVYSTGEVRMRHFSLALPFVMLAASIGLERLARIAGNCGGLVLVVACVLLAAIGTPRTSALVSDPSGIGAVLEFVGNQPVASTNGPVMAYYIGEGNTNARLRPAFIDTPADLRALAGSYPLLVVDMQAYLFPSTLTDRYDGARPLLDVRNGNDIWYLADLLEHGGVAWGDWRGLLNTWTAHRDGATRIRLYALGDLVDSPPQ